MRDDIHRKLPLPSPWRSFVRSCTRESERHEREARAQRAAAFELRQVSPALLNAAREPQQRDFFAGPDLRLRALARSSIDHAFVSELAIVPDGDRTRAVARALTGALENQLEAARREVRVHTALVDRKNTAKVLSNVDAATKSAEIPTLVASFVERGELPGRFRRPKLDLEEGIS